MERLNFFQIAHPILGRAAILQDYKNGPKFHPAVGYTNSESTPNISLQELTNPCMRTVTFNLCATMVGNYSDLAQTRYFKRYNTIALTFYEFS